MVLGWHKKQLNQSLCSSSPSTALTRMPNRKRLSIDNRSRSRDNWKTQADSGVRNALPGIEASKIAGHERQTEGWSLDIFGRSPVDRYLSCAIIKVFRRNDLLQEPLRVSVSPSRDESERRHTSQTIDLVVKDCWCFQVSEPVHCHSLELCL